MNKDNDCIKEFVELFANILCDDVEVIKLNASKFINKLYADRFKQMIADNAKALNEINNNPDMDIKEKIKVLSVIMLNASAVNIDDMKTLTQKEAKSYWNVVNFARNKFDGVMRNVLVNINNLANEVAHPKKEDEDLTKLSKEELIERLRRK